MKSCSGSYFICEWGVNSYVNIISSSLNYVTDEIKPFDISGICLINISPYFLLLFQIHTETWY
jgi:hypothetical protein